MRKVSDLLPDRLNRLRIRKPVEASAVCRACDAALGKAFDHGVPMRAVSFKNGTVNVAVISPAWSHELTAAADEVVDHTNTELGKKTVTKLRARVAPGLARGEDQIT
ncbi:MAG: DUF721 domain-containing protein [bacterium]|nr:DUF721 domain-containing protein [bacterium]MDZ4247738.1 DUF721 domain-containing protein [Patescibacteria group bacterium]